MEPVDILKAARRKMGRSQCIEKIKHDVPDAVEIPKEILNVD